MERAMVTGRRKVERRKQGLSVAQERRRSERRLRDDRRRQIRLSVELWMEEVTGEDVYFRHSGNISSGGVYFEHALPHPPGTELTLRFTLPDTAEEIVARAEVTNCSAEGLGMGARFVSFSGDGEERLCRYLSNLMGDPSALE